MTSQKTESMDLAGVPCPVNFARVLLRLESMDPGDLLDIRIDDGEPFDNVPHAVADEGHTIMETERTPAGWRLLIRRE